MKIISPENHSGFLYISIEIEMLKIQEVEIAEK